MKRILLITHEASRTGAPWVVLHLARWLREFRPEVAVDVLAVKGGALADEFRKVADQYVEWSVPPPPRKGLLLRAWHKGLRLAGLYKEPTATEVKDLLLQELAHRAPDVILANSLASIPVGNRVRELAGGVPVLIPFIHELATVIRQVMPDLRGHLHGVEHVWAASALVEQELVAVWGVEPDVVAVQYECATVRPLSVEAGPRERSGGLVVGGSGSVIPRKGPDLFVQVAAWVRRHHPELDVRFVWVGAVLPQVADMIARDLKLAGLADQVRFVGEQADPFQWYERFDLFLLTSREDPFPLVCIETGALGMPIVCFDGATGTAEVLRNGGGVMVPYLDVEAMGRAVVEYALDAERRRSDGALNARQFARFAPEVQAPLMWQKMLAAWEGRSGKRS